MELVHDKIKKHVDDGDRLHDDSLCAIADVFARTCPLIGNCRFPAYITPDMAREWFDTPKLINLHRMVRWGWPLPSTSADTPDLHPAIEIFRAIV